LSQRDARVLHPDLARDPACGLPSHSELTLSSATGQGSGPRQPTDGTGDALARVSAAPLLRHLDEGYPLRLPRWHRSYLPNQTILPAGEGANDVVLIIEGSVRVLLHGPSGQEWPVARLERGDVLRLPTFAPACRGVLSARAVTEAVVAIMNSEELVYSLAWHPESLARLFSALAWQARQWHRWRLAYLPEVPVTRAETVHDHTRMPDAWGTDPTARPRPRSARRARDA
jgi:hypothetical protein